MTASVQEVMTTQVVAVTPDTPFKQVVERMLEAGVSGVPVVDSSGRVTGIVTEADLMTREAYDGHRHRPLSLVAHYLAGHDPAWVRKSSALTAADIMTVNPIAASPDDSVTAAARRMLEVGVKRLPVVEGGRLVGIVARSDLLRVFLRSDTEINDAVTAVMADARRVPENHEARWNVRDGVVQLDGWVERPSDADLVRHVIAAIPGVVAVESKLVARRPEAQLR